MKNVIIIIGTIILGIVIVNTMILGTDEDTLQGAAERVVKDGTNGIITDFDKAIGVSK